MYSVQLLTVTMFVMVVGVLSVARREFCELKAKKGPCTNFETRWAYSSEKGKCVQFNYGGCRGNPNNFGSKSECRTYCEEPNRGCFEPTEGRWYRDGESKHTDIPCGCACVKGLWACSSCDRNVLECPSIRCINDCPHGYKADERGCATCQCKRKPALEFYCTEYCRLCAEHDWLECPEDCYCNQPSF